MRNPDLYAEWTGLWRGTDSLGGLHYGVRTRLAEGGRLIDFWYFDSEGEVSVETFPADSFEIVNLYALNYGSYEPTWIYRYTAEGKNLPVFEVREYYDGSYEAWLVAGEGNRGRRTSLFEGSVRPLSSQVPLTGIEKYPSIPYLGEFLRGISPGELPSVLEKLPGRYFRVRGEVATTSRSHYEAYEAFSQFPEGFRETSVLEPVRGPRGLLTFEITTPLVPCDADEEDWRALPSPFGSPGEVEKTGLRCIARYKSHQRVALEGPGSDDYTLRFELIRRLP